MEQAYISEGTSIDKVSVAPDDRGVLELCEIPFSTIPLVYCYIVLERNLIHPFSLIYS
jgi:hypothetical protein